MKSPRLRPPALPRSSKKPVKPPALPSSPAPSLLNPEELERYTDFLIFARTAVQGLLAGRHPSRRYGSSAEFFDYKAYTPGDDPEHIDWRVFARTRKLYLRKFKEETEMTAYLLVDASGSMHYAAPGAKPKFFQTARIAAAIIYLMIRQGDKAGLALFADRVLDYLPAGSTRGHLHHLLSRLEKTKPTLGVSTGLAASLHECAALFRRPGRLVILSDFLDDHAAVLDALNLFVHRGFEILLLQVLDPNELNLPEVEIARFVDLETGEELAVEPAAIRAHYQKTMKDLLRSLEDTASRQRIQYRQVSNRQPYWEALEAYLGFRGENAFSL